MAQSQPAASKRPAPRLYLVTPVIEDPAAFAGALRDAVAAADIAAVLLRLKAAGERDLINRVKLLAPLVQSRDTALVLDGHPEVAARAGADGAHLTGLAAFSAAVGNLKPAKIAGCGGITSRDDAMVAGEQGADYVMFGDITAEHRRAPLPAIIERIEWWAGLFEVPCVGFATNPSEIGPLCAAGADFVAVGDGIWDDPRGIAAAVADAALKLAPLEPAQ
jgi:thiamine-phosphate pyrophosphorylase